jgi:DNA polymerase I-like protein with 3'-5' exonuclease and polymerase domains
MLENLFSFDPPIEAIQKRDPYELGLRQCANWDKSKRRLLIVCQSVDGRDLRNGQIMATGDTRKPMMNAIKYARKIADTYLKPEQKVVPSFALTIANFNAHKHLHLGTGPKAAAESAFADRMRRLIKKIRPTHILFSGDEAMHNCFPSVVDPQYKRGWVHELKYDDLNLKVTSTLDFYRLLEKQGEYANLLGFWCRHLSNLMLGRNPHDISHVQPEPVYVDTLQAFDGLMRKFDEAKLCAVDTETRNLSILFNKIYTIQMAFDTDPTKGYVLSVDHPMCHWNVDERAYIKKQLRKRFGAQDGPMLVTFNGMFDLRVIRQQLKLPIIWLPVWEITFGEHSLDENIGALNKVTPMRDALMDDSSRFGGLSPILCSYGNDFYRRAKFGKKERVNVGSTDPTDKGFLAYGAMDVVSLLAIRKQQIARSSFIEIAGKNFKPYYVRHMRYQMSDTAHQLSHLWQDGSKIQKSYLRFLLSSESPLKKELKRAIGEFRIHKEVKQANSELLKESGFKASGLFRKVAERWMFKLSRTPHKAKLFFDILGLPHLTQTKTGAPAIDKNYVAHYKDKNKIIGLYGEYQALSKLLSTYAKGWYKRLSTSLDAAKDNHLRPTYSIWAVVTGRLASMGPNLQQIPSRGKLAKIIKRMFVATPGYLMIRYDYSAHEVRVWSIASGDMVLAEAFRAGQKLRQEFIQNPTDENKKAIKEKGDIHILNVLRFFGQLVDKDHPLRDAVKAVVFGVLYGKGAETLGIDTKKADLDKLKGAISALYDESLKPETERKRVAEINAQLEELDVKLTALIEEDRTDYAQGIIDKMMSEFKKGAAWTEKMQHMAETEYYVYAPNGRRRFLPAAMTEDRQIVAQQVRRGSNAPVQGFASEIGVRAGREIMRAYYANLDRLKGWLKIDKTNWMMRILFNRTVHDANYYSVPYAMVIPFIHMMQYQATYGVTKAYKDEFNLDFTVEPEIEIEMGAHDAQTYKWDWSIPNLITNLKSTLADSKELGVLAGEPDDVLEEILRPWRSKKIRKFLQSEFPLLNVRDLDTQIDAALAALDETETT